MSIAGTFIIAAISACLAAIAAFLYAQFKYKKSLDDGQTEHEKVSNILRAERDGAVSANYAKSAFLANLSHEIRTPLNGILGLTDILSGDELTTGQMRKVNLINDSGETLMRLLNDILDISKIEAGGMEIEPRNVDLNEILQKAYAFWYPVAGEKNIKLVFQKQKSLPLRVVADSVRVRQCLDNLINNALKFTPEHGQVTVKATSMPSGEQRTIVVAVEDTGVGITSGALAKIFEPFKQADSKTARKFGGTGLGLAITRKLCRLMGGDVVVQSELGRGTAFLMSFVANVAEVGEPNPADTISGHVSQEVIDSLDGLSCLVVEDNVVNLEVLRLLLEPFDMQFVETKNGQEALDALTTQHFDFVLMDIQMPVMGGVEATEFIRKSREPYASIPVIAMTANALSADRDMCMEAGVDVFLTKPLKRSELAVAISSTVFPSQFSAESAA